MHVRKTVVAICGLMLMVAIPAASSVESIRVGAHRSQRRERERQEGEETLSLKELGLAWPEYIYSLSHIALPFAPDDPVYGNDSASENPGVRLGRLALRGENRTLAIPNTAMTRLHWNPFYPFLSDRVRAFVAGR